MMMNGKLWHSDLIGKNNVYAYLRRSFYLEDMPKDALVHITADTHYRLYVNGRYLGQGPVPSEPGKVFYDTYDLSECLIKGKNLMAVLVYYCGRDHSSYVRGDGGLWIEGALVLEDTRKMALEMDGNWKLCRAAAWIPDGLGWNEATGFPEFFDARNGLDEWEGVNFDDGGWDCAQVMKGGFAPHGETEILPRLAPLIEEARIAAVFASAHHVAKEAPCVKNGSSLPRLMMEEPWEDLPSKNTSGTNFVLDSLRKDGVALAYDLGQETVGHLFVELTSSPGITLDLGYAEILDAGRPNIYHADRYVTKAGKQSWTAFRYRAARYLVVAVRAGETPTINRVGMFSRMASFHERALFQSSDTLLDGIFQMCKRTIRLCAQEIMVDCPSYEQAQYPGDAVLVGHFLHILGGDSSHWRQLILQGCFAQKPDGQLNAVFPSGSYPYPLFDYTLIWIRSMMDFARYTGNTADLSYWLEAALKALSWFARHKNDEGLICLNGPLEHAARRGVVFIDHPGIWHRFSYPGIDRDGISAGLNIFYLAAIESVVWLLMLAGRNEEQKAFDAQARHLRGIIHKTFWDDAAGVYVDAVKNGKKSSQISQQTNSLAIVYGVCPQEKIRSVLMRVLNEDPKLCRVTPYFAYYLFRALSSAGMQDRILEMVKSLWKPMLDAGATTCWETFERDSRSRCHAWSATPFYECLAELAGIYPQEYKDGMIVMRPRMDLLESLDAAFATVWGKAGMSWRRKNDMVELSLQIPDGARARLELPHGFQAGVSGNAPGIHQVLSPGQYKILVGIK